MEWWHPYPSDGTPSIPKMMGAFSHGRRAIIRWALIGLALFAAPSIVISLDPGAASGSGLPKSIGGYPSNSLAAKCVANVLFGVTQLATAQQRGPSAISKTTFELGARFGGQSPTMQIILNVFGPFNASTHTGHTQQAATAAAKEIKADCGSEFGSNVSPPSITFPLPLKTSGGISGIEIALLHAFESDGLLDQIPNAKVDCGPGSASLTKDHYLACRIVAHGYLSFVYLVGITSQAGRTVSVVSDSLTCSTMNARERAAFLLFDGSRSCSSGTNPSAIRTLPANATASTAITNAVESVQLPTTSKLSTEDLAIAVVYEVTDPRNQNWVAYYVTPSPANQGSFAIEGGLAQFSRGTWKVVTGPSSSLGCGIPTSVPKSVLTALGITQTGDC